MKRKSWLLYETRWRCNLTDASKAKKTAILWFVASALSLAAALLRYGSDEEVRWPLLAAVVFLAAMGFSTLRRSRAGGA